MGEPHRAKACVATNNSNRRRPEDKTRDVVNWTLVESNALSVYLCVTHALALVQENLSRKMLCFLDNHEPLPHQSETP